MTTWLLLAIAAQFLYAVSLLVDRHIVVRAAYIGKPIVYAFYTSLLSGAILFVASVGVSWPTVVVLALSAITGSTFLSALYCLYNALTVARASDAAPVIGAVSALTTAILAPLLIDGDITSSLIAPVAFLVAGTALISHLHFTRRAFVYVLIAGVLFGITILLTKIIFLETTFLNGLFWTRAMNVVAALSLLFVPVIRTAVVHGGRHASRGSKLLVVGNKTLAGSASLLTALAVSMGSVSVVNALAGLQFAFLFLFALLFARYMPRLRDGVTHGHGGWHSAVGIACIVLGFALLYHTL